MCIFMKNLMYCLTHLFFYLKSCLISHDDSCKILICFPGLYGAIMRTGKMKDITQFDAEFFGYPPALAERSDPQQRMLLEVVYEAIVDAGWIGFYVIQYFYLLRHQLN